MADQRLLSNKVAVVTGASRGIGSAIALAFAAEGAALVLVSLKNKKGLLEVQKKVEQFGVSCFIMLGDVSDQQFCRDVYEETVRRFNHADILVNCAGIIARAPMEEMSMDDWHRVIDVNLHGSFYMCKMFLPGMRKRQYGRIINLTSQMAFMPHPSASPSYEVSKSALNALTKHLALQYAAYNICVNAIAPGSIDTDMPKSMSHDARERLKNGIPMKRLGELHEVGSCAVFLASEMSSYMTGTTLHVNGGSLMI